MVANFLYNYINLKLFPFKERDEKKNEQMDFLVFLCVLNFN